ncbi:hypothetical protein [Streptomyces sp. MST-110588]|uniref:hypothetical protein n=1 Tax=Streptomyces sp. MST-110588 TaxID=2833628 RepID=UPI001F5C2679|nr:hypothetical protein [Streptomyces sp. MST-110588]UNO42168.1 hypothetical protein KGS77_24935 [Streptomyces sp. MST-110588]
MIKDVARGHRSPKEHAVSIPPPGAEPTLWELHRAVVQLREDQRDDLAQLRDDLRSDIAALANRLNQVVTVDVYRADQRNLTLRIDTLERELETVRAERDQDREQASTNRRLIISAFIAPVLLTVLQLLLAARGSP